MCDVAQNLDLEEDEETMELGTLGLNKQFGLPGLLFSLLDYEVDPRYIFCRMIPNFEMAGVGFDSKVWSLSLM